MSQLDLQAELNVTKQQVEEYKSKYFQCQKELENKNKEIEGLRSMMLQTQSLRGTDGRQSDDLRRNLQVALNENQALKQQIEELKNQTQQQVGMQMQPQFQTQYEINRLNNDKILLQGNIDILQQQFDQKIKDYDQLKVRIQAVDFIQNLPQGQEANKILVMGKEIQRLNQQLLSKDAEIEGLKLQVTEQQRAVQERDNLSQQLRAYEDKVRNLSSDIENMLMQVGGLRHDVTLKSELERVKQQLQESEKEQLVWKDKYQKLENDSKHLQELERKTNDYEARLIRTSEDNERLEQENRGIQLKLQAFDRLLKDKEQMERKLQDQESAIQSNESQMNEKRREIESLRNKNRELEQDFVNFKENIFRPNEERQKRLELEIENWRNKCLALESNFFGNNERMYIENELKRLHGIIVAQQQELEDLKSMKQQKSNYGDEQRVKILYSERERLYIELEEARKKILQLERQPNRMPLNLTEEDKDQQLEELKQGIEQLIEENKSLKQQIDKQEVQIEQLEIDKNYIRSKQIAPKETMLDMLSKQPDLHKNVLEQLTRRLYADVKEKERQLQSMNQNLTVSQQMQREQRITELEQQIKLIVDSSQQQQQQQQQQIESLNNSRISGSPARKKIFQQQQIDVQKLLEETVQLRKQVEELRLQKDYEFVEYLESKERDVEMMRQKFLSEPDNVVDLKKMRDILEQKSYEAQEWKDKYMQIQMHSRIKENQVYDKPYSSNLLEQEYRKLKQLYEMKVIEVEELRQKSPNYQFGDSSNMDTAKLRRLLELRTAECEEWRSKYLKSNVLGGGSMNNNAQELEDQMRRMKNIHDNKHREVEEWKQRYNQAIKNKDQNAGQAIDELQGELTKYKRLHDAKHMELQELNPKIMKLKLAQQEKDVIENELRKVKYSLESQINENEQLKRRLGQSNIVSQPQNDRVLKEQQQKILLLQQQLQQAQNQMSDQNNEHNKLKQTHFAKQDQIKSIAMNIDNKDQQLRQMNEDISKLKMGLEQKNRDCEDLKNQLLKTQTALQNQAREYQEYRKSTQSSEAYKAQLAIAGNKVNEAEKKIQQVQGDLQKMQSLLRDKVNEIEKLKESLGKVNLFQQEKNQIVQQLQQAKTTLQEKQKENEKLKQSYAQLTQQHQKLQQQDNETKTQLSKLKAVLGSFQH